MSRREGSNPQPFAYPNVLKILPEPPVGIEPTTYCLQNSCSTTELGWQNFIRTSRTLDILTKSMILRISEQNCCSTIELLRRSYALAIAKASEAQAF